MHNGKQNYKCKECGRQFVLHPEKQPISDKTKGLIDRLLLERLSLAGIARAVGVSESWLQKYVNKKLESVPQTIEQQPSTTKKKFCLAELDEMWSFVENKDNKQWVWLAIDQCSRRIIGAYIGKRDEDGAKAVWDSLPQVYRDTAYCYTDGLPSYAAIIPPERLIVVEKGSGKTSLIERLNNTIRQRLGRFTRKTLSFSKKIENHIGIIWMFIHDYNRSLPI
ncbi:IS1 family transposase [Magnetococcales bacterium HHB-1]